MTRLPPRAGVGFKPQHLADIRRDPHPPAFFEVHAENYMGAGGLPHAQLAALRADHALSVHGVGLSIGDAGRLDAGHLARLRALCDRYEPESFSEHLAWSSHGAEYLNDLLPLPYTSGTLAAVCDHVDQVQQVLGRRMLLENPATYVLFAQSDIPETEYSWRRSPPAPAAGFCWTSTTSSCPAPTTAAIRAPIWPISRWTAWERSTWAGTRPRICLRDRC